MRQNKEISIDEKFKLHKMLFIAVPNTIGFRERQIHPLYHGPVMRSLKVNNPKTGKHQL